MTIGVMNIVRKSIGLLAALAIMAPMSAQAVPTTYADLASFEADSTITLTDDFNGSGLTYNTPLASFSSNGVTYTGLAGDPTPNVYLVAGALESGAGGSTILAANGQEDFRLDFGTGVSAVGLDTYTNGLGAITITLVDVNNDSFVFSHDHAITEAGFFGVVSTVDIASLRWTASQGHLINTGIDNVRIGTAGAADVAEPATLALLGLGLLGVGARRRQVR